VTVPPAGGAFGQSAGGARHPQVKDIHEGGERKHFAIDNYTPRADRPNISSGRGIPGGSSVSHSVEVPGTKSIVRAQVARQNADREALESSLQEFQAQEARLKSTIKDSLLGASPFDRQSPEPLAIADSSKGPPGMASVGPSAASQRTPPWLRDSVPKVGGSVHLGIGTTSPRARYSSQTRKADKVNEEAMDRIYDEKMNILRSEIDQLQARHAGLEDRMKRLRSTNTRLTIEDNGSPKKSGVMRMYTTGSGTGARAG